MKNHHLSLLFLLFSFATPLCAQTYTLNWGSSFSPVWANSHVTGSASNIGGSGINATVSITKSGGAYSHSDGNTGVSTPTVSGTAFTVGGSSSNLEIAMDFDSHTEYTDIVYQFSSPVTHVHFEVADIDKPDAGSVQYLDEVIITGADGAVTYLPTLTKYDATTDPNFLVIAGNTAYANPASGHGGNTASTVSDQKGTVIVNFGNNLVNTVTIRYKNETGAQNDPLAQGIAIGNLSFQKLSVLPVSFTYINAREQGNNNIIQWQTATEQHNSHFEIEKSFDGQSWTKIGVVAGAGTSAGPKDYFFTDPLAKPGITHYRIRQVDQDGRSNYSAIVTLTRTAEHFSVSVYPNPVDASSVVTFYTDKADELTIQLADMHGRIVFTDDWPVSKGDNEISLSRFAKLAKGHYVLRLYGSVTGYRKTIRLLKR